MNKRVALPYCLILWTVFLAQPNILLTQASSHEIVKGADGSFVLYRNGQPYFIQGAGADAPNLYFELSQRGGNSVRTWGVGPDTQVALDSAQANGLSILVGLWVRHEADGFNYDDTTAVKNQLEGFRHWVRTYKDHPAILGWGIGNEVNLGYTNLKVWGAINQISEMIHEETEGKHLTTTVLAGTGPTLVNHLAERAPDLDFLSLNLYGGISAARNSIENSRWDKAYAITEWGINGPWESPSTTWGAPIEPNSTEKAALIGQRYDNHILPHTDRLLGSYVFLWSNKQEGTLTWFGLWVKQETTEMIDEMQKRWQGALPANRAPKIQIVGINGTPQSQSVVINQANDNLVEVFAFDPDGDELSYEYLIQPWPNSLSTGLETVEGATFRTIPGVVAEQDGSEAILQFSEDHNFKNYRLFVLVRDGKGHIGTATFPFRVEIVEQNIPATTKLVVQDAYVRNGDYSAFQLGRTDADHLEVKTSQTPSFQREIYLQFDLSGFDTLPPSAYFLRLHGQAPMPLSIEVAPTANNLEWSEENISWDSKPPSGSVLTSTVIGVEKQWYEWDLSDHIEEQLTSGNLLINLTLRGEAQYIGDPAVFVSKERGFNAPRIEARSVSVVLPRSPEQAIRIFPNPTPGHLEVQANEKIKELRIYDQTSQLLRVSKGPQIDDLNLPGGVYYVQVIVQGFRPVLRKLIIIP